MPDDGPWTKYASPADEDGPWKKYGAPQQLAPAPEQPPDLFQQALGTAKEGAKNVAIGAGKGLLHTGTALSPLLNKIPVVGESLAPSVGVKAAQNVSRPEGTAQQAGYVGEQIGEWLLPTGAEEKAGLAAARLLPRLGKAAPMLGRVGAGALESGVRSSLQSGDVTSGEGFGSGALLGAGTGLIGEGARAVAPKLAESALGITKKMRGFGKTPGEAVLSEVKGIRPGTIEQNAIDKLGQLTTELENRATASTATASTSPAQSILHNEMGKAVQQNNRVLHGALSDVLNQLTVDFTTGQAIPSQITARKILDLKRGIGDLEGTWNPELRGKLKGTIRQVYNALDKELDRTVPGADQLNQRISSLIPVKERAGSIGRGDELVQRVLHRVGAHTGALAGTISGSYYGGKEGGVPGAILGGAAGLVLPEALGSPAAQMLGARALRSKIPLQIVRGSGSQLLGRGNQTQ